MSIILTNIYFTCFKHPSKLKEYNINIQYYIPKNTHNYNYHIITYFAKLCTQTSPNSITISHTHITITTMHTLNYHMTLMWLNVRHVTLCMRYLNVNPTFHRFPIQYLESKPPRLFPIKDQRLLRLFLIKDQRLYGPNVPPLSVTPL